MATTVGAPERLAVTPPTREGLATVTPGSGVMSCAMAPLPALKAAPGDSAANSSASVPDAGSAPAVVLTNRSVPSAVATQSWPAAMEYGHTLPVSERTQTPFAWITSWRSSS